MAVKRTTCWRLLAEFKERISHVNSDDKFIDEVVYAAVFGSYVSTHKPTLGDLDICIHTQRKAIYRDHDRLVKHMRSSPGGWLDLCLSHYRFLKGKSKRISLHDWVCDGGVMLAGPHEILFGAQPPLRDWEEVKRELVTGAA